MKQKILLLPGFGENEKCFRNLKPFLKNFDLVDVDYRPSLKKLNLWDTKPSGLAKELVTLYKIQENDLLVGHSMGGYFSHNISILNGNKTCLIGSFTDANKIIRFTQNQFVNHFVTGSGLIKTNFMRDYIQSRTRSAAIKKEMLSIHNNFHSFTNDAMLKMSILSFGEELPPAQVEPFHIHAMDDTVVRPPDASFEKVRGGHFSIIFHPDEVFEKMDNGFLR